MRRWLTCTLLSVAVLGITGAAFGAQLTIMLDDIVALEPPAESEETTRFLLALSLPVALEGTTIDFAKLTMGVRVGTGELSGEETPFIVDAYAITTEWDPEAVGWSTGWDTPGGDFDEATHASHIGVADTTTSVSLDLTHVLQTWVDGDIGNAGIIIAIPSATCWGITEIDGSSHEPTVAVYYTRGEE